MKYPDHIKTMKGTVKNKVNTINCEEAAKRFNDFIDHYIKGRRKNELTVHIETCRHCFERLEFEKMLKSKIAETGQKSSANKDVQAKFGKIMSKIYPT